MTPLREGEGPDRQEPQYTLGKTEEDEELGEVIFYLCCGLAHGYECDTTTTIDDDYDCRYYEWSWLQQHQKLLLFQLQLWQQPKSLNNNNNTETIAKQNNEKNSSFIVIQLHVEL